MKHLVERLLKPVLKNREPKVVFNVITDVYGKLKFNGIDEHLLKSFIVDRDNNNLYKSLNFLNESETPLNILDYLIVPEYIPILKTLFLCKPNIGTPNAQTGEFEISFLVTIPKAKKPKKGDFYTPSTGILNLKNDSPRIFSEVRGNQLNSVMKKVFKKFGVTPKSYNGVEYCQLLNENYVKNYFNPQFTKLGLSNNDLSEILSEWLINLFPEKNIQNSEIKEIVEKVLAENQIVWDKWLQENMIFIFKYSKNRDEKYIMVKENGEVFCLTRNEDNFRKLVEEEKLTFGKDFFRLNQKGECGYYLKINI